MAYRLESLTGDALKKIIKVSEAIPDMANSIEKSSTRPSFANEWSVDDQTGSFSFKLISMPRAIHDEYLFFHSDRLYMVKVSLMFGNIDGIEKINGDMGIDEKKQITCDMKKSLEVYGENRNGKWESRYCVIEGNV